MGPIQVDRTLGQRRYDRSGTPMSRVKRAVVIAASSGSLWLRYRLPTA